MRRNDAFDPIPPPPPPPPTVRRSSWAAQGSTPLEDIRAAVALQVPPVSIPSVVSLEQYRVLVGVEVGLAWSRSERSWLEALWAWFRNEL